MNERENDIDELLHKCARLCPPSEEKFEPPHSKKPAPTLVSTGTLGQTDLRNIQDKQVTRQALQRLGRYRILAKIGKGAMGEVYRAQDTSLCRPVALKVLSSQAMLEKTSLQRFQREAKSAARLRNAHIVDIYDFKQVDGTYFLVMQLVDGQPLSNLLRTKRLPMRRICKIILDILDGIGYAHRRGIIHRDLKPSNILLDRDKNLFISDFGLAKALKNDGASISQTGAVLGTPAYMSPEQAQGDSSCPVDAQSDIYSIGAIFYEMLTGRTPFQGDSLYGLFYKLANENVIEPSKINPRIPLCLEEICMKALSKSKKLRYQTAEEMVSDIQKYLESPNSISMIALKSSLRRRMRQFTKKWPIAGKRIKKHGIKIAAVLTVMIISASLFFKNSPEKNELTATALQNPRHESEKSGEGAQGQGSPVEKEDQVITQTKSGGPDEKNTKYNLRQCKEKIMPKWNKEKRYKDEKAKRYSRKRHRVEKASRKKHFWAEVDRMDADKDTMINRGEWWGRPRAFKNFDKDGDGFLTRKELKKIWQRQRRWRRRNGRFDNRARKRKRTAHSGVEDLDSPRRH